MSNVPNRTVRFGAVLAVLFALAVGTASAGQEYVMKIAFTDGAMTRIGKVEVPHPSYAAMLAFKNSLEKSSSGRIKVELYPGGVLGDAKSNLEQMLVNLLEGATPADGALAPFYANIQVLSVPYLFKDALEAYDLLDSALMKEIIDDMASKSRLRIVASYDNGGFRNFTNSKREVRSAADLKGLKIRTMDIPAHMEMVRALGASPTPIAFLELYSALQTGVVDGQENSAITTFSASLQEVQKYGTLDGHLLGLAFLVISENFYQGLPGDLQQLVLRAGREASIGARGMVRACESIAISALAENGMTLYSPTAQELDTFKIAQKPVLDFLRKNVDNAYLDRVLKYVETGGSSEGGK